MTTLLLRRLSAGDSASYNAFFREGALLHPGTLRIAPEDFAGTPFATAPDAEAVTLAAVDTGAPGAFLGVGSVERERGRAKRRHIAWIMRMYVPTRHGKRGVGRAILRALIAEATSMPGVAKANLTVAAHNEAAIALYESEGFVTFSREDDAFRDPRPRTELSMSRALER